MKAIIALLACSSAAVAAPCDVRIVRAPDEVRAKIDTWIAAEPTCSRALELRVIEVREGLYLFARDDRGRVHERLVPDAESAGVLVASWAADDSFVAPSEFDIAPPDFDDDPVVVEDEDEPRRGAIATRTYEVDEETPVRRTKTLRYLSLGFLGGDGGKTHGLRGEFEVYAGPHWALGVAAQTSASELAADDAQTQYKDQQLTLYVARVYRGTKWFARGGAGIGFTHASGVRWSSSPYATSLMKLDGDGAVIEAVVDVSRRISKRWALQVGILAQRYAQTFQTENLYSYGLSPYTSQMVTLERDELAVSFVGGVKVGL